MKEKRASNRRRGKNARRHKVSLNGAQEREIAQAPQEIRRRIRWLSIGTAVELAA
jgi:hypothetical protein